MSKWAWDGGRPSVDLLNTIRDRVQDPRETLHSPADLTGWLRETDLNAGTRDADEADLETARRLRAAIDLLVFPEDRGAPDLSEAVGVINSLAAGAVVPPRLVLDGGRVVVVPPEPSVAVALARVALDAVDLLAGDEVLRVCAAGDCGIRFVDRSPAHNRQWCSMRRCGNRTKARRHYERARG